MGTCYALLDIVCAGQWELDDGREFAFAQLYFSAAFDWVITVACCLSCGMLALVAKFWQSWSTF